MARRIGGRAVIGALGVVLSAGWVGACASAPTDSVVHGTIVAESFPSAIHTIVADGSDGTRVTATVDAASAFSLVLHATSYTLKTVAADATETPLALAGSNGAYALELRVTSGGARVDLGRVRLRDARPSTALKAPFQLPAPLTCSDGALTDGTPCVADEAVIACEDHGCPNMGGDEHGEHGDGDDDDDDDAETDDDVVDPSGAETTPLVIVAGPVALPEHGVSSTVDCGDGDGEHHGHEDHD